MVMCAFVAWIKNRVDEHRMICACFVRSFLTHALIYEQKCSYALNGSGILGHCHIMTHIAVIAFSMVCIIFVVRLWRATTPCQRVVGRPVAESPEVIIVTVRCGPYESLMSGLY